MLYVAFERVEGVPNPVVRCPWSKRRKRRRLRQIQDIVERASDKEVVYYEDEVDIHLNPKIGEDWMARSQQKEVVTPGKNVKRYLAGALNHKTGELVWVESETKDTMLFITLLWKLLHMHPGKTIHLILDNYCIHHAKWVKELLATKEGSRLRLHFLPPYCPDDNRIERLWQDLHANVTRNHCCTSIGQLMRNVRYYLNKRNRQRLSMETGT